MKCNNCDAEPQRACIIDSDGYSSGTLTRFKDGKGDMLLGRLVYCPRCGNLQVDAKKEN